MEVNRAMYWKSVLRWGGLPVSKRNMWVGVAWLAMESGWEDSKGIWHPGAKWNPMNTTQKMPGSTDFNVNGGFPVQNYVDEEQGLEAFWKTITNPEYPSYGRILASLRANAWAIRTMRTIEKSDWGTHFQPNAGAMLHSVKHYWPSYANKAIGQ